jgi:hypothetical protein
MKEAEKPMTEQESLALITTMINRAKDVNHSTGLTSIMWGLVITDMFTGAVGGDPL